MCSDPESFFQDQDKPTNNPFAPFVYPVAPEDGTGASLRFKNKHPEHPVNPAYPVAPADGTGV